MTQKEKKGMWDGKKSGESLKRNFILGRLTINKEK